LLKVCDNLVDELLGIERKHAMGVPGDARLFSNRRAAMHQGHAPDGVLRDRHVGGKHRNSVADARRRDERMGRAALQKCARTDARDRTGGNEPETCAKVLAQQKQWLVGPGPQWRWPRGPFLTRTYRSLHGSDISAADGTPDAWCPESDGHP
jgi:hypothetical protein